MSPIRVFGIPAREVGRIFDRFNQVEPHLSRTHGGLGLGLAIAKRLVELHGGRIWVESAPGHGSTFTFRLPGACRTETGPVSREGSPLVLVIEDDMVAADLIRTQLMEGGYRVALVASGHAGLGAAKRLLPQAITLDLGLPDLLRPRCR